MKNSSWFKRAAGTVLAAAMVCSLAVPAFAATAPAPAAAAATTVTADAAAKPKKVTLNMKSKVMKKGQSVRLRFTVSPSNASKKATWTSSNKKVATVSKNGTVKALANGKTTITVNIRGRKAKATIQVVAKLTGKYTPVKNVKLSAGSKALTVGESFTLKATVNPKKAGNKKVSWASSNEAVASVNAKGLVTAKAAGSATITVTSNEGGKTAKCTVTVKEAAPTNVAVTGVSVTPATLALTVGQTGEVKATVAPANATNAKVAWASSNAAVATVDAKGAVAAKATGSATITVTTEDGAKTATCAVTVTADKAALNVAIAAAEADLAATKKSTDGEDVATTEKWALEADLNDYADAIAAAKAVAAKADAAQADVDKAKTDLDAATTLFTGKKSAGKMDMAGLIAAIAAAEADRDSVKISSTNGSDVYTDEKWVAQEDVDEYNNAINAAQDVVDDPDATKTAVDAAISALSTATTTFAGKKADGTKEPVVTGVAVKSDPTKMEYVEGDTLALDGLVVTLSFDHGENEDVAFAGFETKGLTASPADDTTLDVATHNGKPVTVTHTATGETADTNDLTVTASPAPKTQLTIADPTITESKVYDGLTTAVVSAGSLENVAEGDTVTVSATATYDNANVGTDKTITVAYTIAGDDADKYIAPVNKVYNDGAITVASATVSDNAKQTIETAVKGVDVGSSITLTVSGVNSETFEGTWACTAPDAAGDAIATFTRTGGTASASNYSSPITATITFQAITGTDGKTE